MTVFLMSDIEIVCREKVSYLMSDSILCCLFGQEFGRKSQIVTG